MRFFLFSRNVRILLCVATILLVRVLGASAASAADFAVTSPWIGYIASFISGDGKNVRSLSDWDASGNVVKKSNPKRGEIVIALNAKDARIFGAKPESVNVRLLYEDMPMTKEQLCSAFFDPAMLPFIARSVMKIMAEEDKEKYSYYQRRLAEFQSKIESTTDIGRHLLGPVKILDITGAEGTWLRSSLSGAVRPPAEVWEAWKSGDTGALKAALDEAKRRKWLILMDPWTPEIVRSVAVGYEFRLTLPPPSGGEDYFVFLHDIFLAISNKTEGAKTK